MPSWYTINHPTTLHTHTMKTQLPNAARECHFALWDVSYSQSRQQLLFVSLKLHLNSSFFWGPINLRVSSQKVTKEATKPQRLGLFWQKKSRFVAACVLCTNLTRPPRLINLWQTLRLKKQALLLTTNTTASSV